MKRTLLEELVVGGLDDWAHEAWIAGIVAQAGSADDAAIRCGAIGLIAEALITSMMVPGDIVDGSHRAWTCDTAEALGRIIHGWTVGGDPAGPTPGSIVWLANTPAGDELAHEVLAREAAAGRRE